MNRCKTTVFRPICACAAFASLFVLLSTVSFAQSQTLSASLSFNNFVAASGGTDDAGLKRPRIVGAEPAKTETAKSIVKPVKAEISKTVVEPATAASGTAMIALQMERQAFDVLNLRRAENNLPPLVWSEDMARVARSHSQEMAQFKFFSHAGRNGSMVDDRADVLGFKKWKAIGENIAYNRGYEQPAEFACERWMMSVSHRENILNPRWQEAGIGVSITADGTYYFTEVFVAR